MSIRMHGLRTVIYPVENLDAATAWWSGLLGVDPYFKEPFYVGFSISGYELGLLPDAEAATGCLTYWGVDDVHTAVSEAVDAGASVHVAASEVGDGIVTATVTTPDGNVVGFIYNPHFSADASST